MITTVTPTVITPMIEAEVRIVSRLLVVANVSAVETPMTHSTTSTATRPRLRPAPVSRALARADGRSARAAAVSTRPCSAAGGTGGVTTVSARLSLPVTGDSLPGLGPP